MKYNVVEESITTALLELMAKKDFSKISITEIVQKAGVSRVTYYRHFDSKEDVLLTYFGIAKDKFLLSVLDLIMEKDWKAVVKAIFLAFKEKKEIVKSLQKAHLDHFFLDYLNNEFLEKRPVPSDYNDYFLYFLAGAVYNTCMGWLKTDCSDPVEEVTESFNKVYNAFAEEKNIKY
jgi:AcrR family transcriptional regulator